MQSEVDFNSSPVLMTRHSACYISSRSFFWGARMTIFTTQIGSDKSLKQWAARDWTTTWIRYTDWKRSISDSIPHIREHNPNRTWIPQPWYRYVRNRSAVPRKRWKSRYAAYKTLHGLAAYSLATKIIRNNGLRVRLCKNIGRTGIWSRKLRKHKTSKHSLHRQTPSRLDESLPRTLY